MQEKEEKVKGSDEMISLMNILTEIGILGISYTDSGWMNICIEKKLHWIIGENIDGQLSPTKDFVRKLYSLMKNKTVSEPKEGTEKWKHGYFPRDAADVMQELEIHYPGFKKAKSKFVLLYFKEFESVLEEAKKQARKEVLEELEKKIASELRTWLYLQDNRCIGFKACGTEEEMTEELLEKNIDKIVSNIISHLK